ncbi:MAG: hypothetical protein AAF702_29340 [Chloroflexota bacterium]
MNNSAYISPSENKEELRRYLRLARKEIWVVLLGVCFAAGVGILIAFQVSPTYHSASVLLVSHSRTTARTNQEFVTEDVIKTYTELLNRRSIAEAAAEVLTIPVEEVWEHVRIRAIPGTPFIEVSAETSNPQYTQNLVNSVVNNFFLFVNQSQKLYPYELTIIEQAALPTNADRSLALRIVIALTLLGFIVSTSAVLLSELFNERIGSVEDIEKHVGIRVLTATPLSGHLRLSKLPSAGKLNPQLLETYRAMLFGMRSFQKGNHAHSILLTSPSAGTEAAAVTLYLGVLLAEQKKKVLLIDANLRHPHLYKPFKANITGQEQYSLQEEYHFQTDSSITAHQTNIPNLSVLTFGNGTMEPLRLFGSPAMAQFMEVIKLQADIILISAPPVLNTADAPVLSTYVDDVILVIDNKREQRSTAVDACAALQGAGANLLGAILVNAESAQQRHYVNYQSQRQRPMRRNASPPQKHPLSNKVRQNAKGRAVKV